MFQICCDQRDCICSLTGPVTLANQLFRSEEGLQCLGGSKQLLVKVVEVFCQIRPDILVLMEERPLAQAELVPAHRRIYNMLKNVISHYDILAALYLQDYSSQNLSQFSALGLDIYTLEVPLGKDLPLLSELWDLGSMALGIGVRVPTDDFERGK